MPIDFRIPGLHWRERGTRKVAYWVCSNGARSKGYPVKTQRLWSGSVGTEPTEAEMTTIRTECFRLRGEMHEWGRRPDTRKSKVWRQRGEVYFAQSGMMVKIGFAKNPSARMSQLRTSAATPITLLGSIPGNREIEKFLHWQFRTLHERGEWFRLEGALADFIAENIRGTTISNAISNVQTSAVVTQ